MGVLKTLIWRVGYCIVLMLGEPRLRQLTEDASPEAWWYRIFPRPNVFPAPSIRRVARWGAQLELDISELVGWYVYWGFADPSHDALIELLSPGDSYIDVGANIGITTLRAAQVVGPAGRVVAVEPHPVLARSLRNHTRVVADRVEVVEAAVSDGRSCLRVISDSTNRGMTRVARESDEDGVSVRSATLDEVFAECGLERVDVLKIDVEGHETHVLRGGEELIRNHRPTVFIEVVDDNLRRQGSSARELLELLGAHAYELQKAGGGDLPQADGLVCDVVARPRDE